MQLYNTLSRAVEPFEPGPEVSVYVCGITPYDTTHLGHAFLYVAFDVLIRHLESKGLPVRYTQNVTDIDDDMLRKAGELGMDYLELGRRETERFVRDMAALNVRSPDHYPRATEEIGRMVEIIEALVAKGHAYEREGNVYYDISSFPSYGALSRANRSEMLDLARERGGNPDDPLRRDPLDFLLWQAAKAGEPSWPSPWGEGRPGWHIECSEMSLHYLGQPVTIHGGGSDLIFPHHESERAQSESYTGEEPFVRYWMHVGMLRYQGDKMSKSLGNLVLVGDLLREHTPDAVRLALLSRHYRDSWEYEDSMIESAQALADRLSAAAELVGSEGPALDVQGMEEAFEQALDDDLDTPAAVAALEQLAGAIEAGAQEGLDVSTAQALLREKGSVLGLAGQQAPVAHGAAQ